MMKAFVILTVIAVCSAFPTDDSIPPKDIQPHSTPFVPPGPQLTEEPKKPLLTASPTDDSIPPKDIEPLLAPGTHLPQESDKPQLEVELEGPQSLPPGDKSQDDLKAENTFWFGYGYPSYRRSYYTYYTPRVYSYYSSGHSHHWNPYYYW